MKYEDMFESPIHEELCQFLESPTKRKQLTLPRGFLKTSIATIAFSIWLALSRHTNDEFPPGIDPNNKLWNLGPDVRILIASNVERNAAKIIHQIKRHYESGLLPLVFPEIIPEKFKDDKWSDVSACLKRNKSYVESTFEACGIGGSAISRHYDVIIESDLIYARKDDLTGAELQPNQEDLDKAIGWHKLAHSLHVPGEHTLIINEGTRWHKNDLVGWIRKHENYDVFNRAAIENEEYIWPQMYGETKCNEIKRTQGNYLWSTQYLCSPKSPEDMLFRREWLQMYISNDEIPKSIRKFTTVDLSGWGTQRRSRQSQAVILTCGWCHKNHVWVLHYDVGRYDPSEVIRLIAKHYRLFSPERVGVESVYYQKSLVHFLKKEMESGRVPWMPLSQLKPEAQQSKELRIRSIEPIASNLAVHCKPEHRDFIEEFVEYSPNNDLCKKDILDALAYQIQIARPGEVQQMSKRKLIDSSKPILPISTMDEFLNEIWKGNRKVDRFGNKGVDMHPYDDTDESLFKEIVNPFYEE